MLQFEQRIWDLGHTRVAGVDEAGRGPLAGPVFAAAVVFERSFIESACSDLFRGLTDSKKLTPGRREHFYELLAGSAGVELGVGCSVPAEIDAVNILRATRLAMIRAVQDLPRLPEVALIDGLSVPDFPCPSQAIVKGDTKSLSIAAASVVAKVTRDRLMIELDRQYPQYGFARHKGYGSSAHVQALMEHGPSPVHRRSFRPVRESALIRDWIRRNPRPAARDADGEAAP